MSKCFTGHNMGSIVYKINSKGCYIVNIFCAISKDIKYNINI